MWGPGILLSSVVFYINSTFSNIFIYATLFLISIWSLRIFLHIGKRFINKKEEDRRYSTWRETWKYFYLRSFFQVFVLQGFLMFLMSISVYSILKDSYFVNISSHFVFNFNFLNFVLLFGFLISVFGLMFETISDLQLIKFLKEKSKEISGGNILKTGLWKYTRHPNYFGEITFWFGILVLSTPFLNPLSLLPFFLISYLILYVSGIPMLEKKYEGNPEFEDYKLKTPAFFPNFFK
jgi:steroid 5-alpha reductase family enzyme